MTTLTREVAVPCRSASRARREREWGSCDELGHKLGSRWIGQSSQEGMPFIYIRITPAAPPPSSVSLDKGAR